MFFDFPLRFFLPILSTFHDVHIHINARSLFSARTIHSYITISHLPFMSTILDYPSFSAAALAWWWCVWFRSYCCTLRPRLFHFIHAIKCAENIENKLCHSLFLDEPVNYYISPMVNTCQSTVAVLWLRHVYSWCSHRRGELHANINCQGKFGEAINRIWDSSFFSFVYCLLTQFSHAFWSLHSFRWGPHRSNGCGIKWLDAMRGSHS